MTFEIPSDLNPALVGLAWLRGRWEGSGYREWPGEEKIKFAQQVAAEPVRKVIASAMANAEQTEGLRGDDLYISQAFVDEGVTMRRIRPRAKGSASHSRSLSTPLSCTCCQPSGAMISAHSPSPCQPSTPSHVRRRSARAGRCSRLTTPSPPIASTALPGPVGSIRSACSGCSAE